MLRPIASDDAVGNLRPLHSGGPSAVAKSEIFIKVKGKKRQAQGVHIEGRTVAVRGRSIKIAAVCEEDLIEGHTIADPESFVTRLKQSDLRADILTFAQRLPASEAKYQFHAEWENAAAIRVTTYQQWLNKSISTSARKSVNRAKRQGAVTRVVELNDDLLHSICRAYNETPVRQGKAFWHYGKSFEAVKRELATYIDRSIFIGAYVGEELIGWLKMTYVDSAAIITVIFSISSHFDKKPNNLLIAKAVEICEQDAKSYLVYGSYVYHNPNSTLTEFKRRNGFEAIPLPRYYIPLTLKGKIALRLGLHRELAAMVPKPLLRLFLKTRKIWMERSLGREKSASTTAAVDD